jgi:hypothetical protein
MPFACDLLPIQLMHGGTQAAALMAKWSNACSLRPRYRDIDSIFDVSGQKLPNSRFNHEDIVRFRNGRIALKLSLVYV